MTGRTGTRARRMIPSLAMACAVIVAIAPSCKGGRKGAKGAASGPQGSGSHILIEAGSPDRDCIYDVIVEETDDSQMADEVYESLGTKFQAPAVLASMDDTGSASDLLEAIKAAGCDVGTASVVNGRIRWKLEVIDQGSGSNCMLDVLRNLVPGTSEADWSAKIGAGKTLHTCTDSEEIEVMRASLEKKCGCRIQKTFAVE